jgi:hypothetical protein
MSESFRQPTPAFVGRIATHDIPAGPGLRALLPALGRAARRTFDVMAGAQTRAGAASFGAAAGTASGLVVALGSGALLLRYVNRGANVLPPESRAFIREYALGITAESMLVCTAVGLLAGLAARYAAGRGERLPVLITLAGLWAGLVMACVIFSPTSMPDAAGLSDLPFAVPVLGAAATAVAAGWAGRVRWRRYAAMQMLLTAPLLAPDPRPGTVAAPIPAPAAEGSVLLLGFDNLGRDGMRMLAERIAARAQVATPGRDPGVRLFSEAISPVPITRFAWGSVLLGRDPNSLFEIDTLTPHERLGYFARQPFLLPREMRRLGYATSYVTDDATSNIYPGREAFDTVHADAIGWQVQARWIVATAFPLAEGYLGRWRAVGVANAPGGAGTWRVFRAVAGELGAGAATPRFVAAHAVSLHAVLRPTAAETGGPLEFLRHTPADLQGEDVLSPLHRPGVATRNVVRQSTVYERRRLRLVEEASDFVAALTAAGHREHTLIVLFTDHGELFYPDATRNLPGLHGMELEPHGVEVGVVALLPTHDRTAAGPAPAAVAHDGLVTIRGPLALQQLGEIVTDFATGAARAGAGRGQWMHSMARGEALPARSIPARSVGRPPLGDSALAKGRAMLTESDRNGAAHLWPDGRITLTPRAVELVHSTSDVGWTDGRRLVSYSTLMRGGHLVQCYDEGRLVRTFELGARPAHPYDPAPPPTAQLRAAQPAPAALCGAASGRAQFATRPSAPTGRGKL